VAVHTVNPGELHVWRIELDRAIDELLPPPEPREAERAARFATEEMRRRYLRSHGAMRAILRSQLGSDPRIGVTEGGKPWLPETPRWKFNLSHSRGTALVAVAMDVEVGVDVEWVRTHRDWEAIAERFFPPSASEAFLAVPDDAKEREFFRFWTRLEAMWKALGVGLNGAGREMEGQWTVENLDLGDGIAGAVAAPAEGLRVVMHNFGETILETLRA
jgi:4'-phosphopantetheinyl transferase